MRDLQSYCREAWPFLPGASSRHALECLVSMLLAIPSDLFRCGLHRSVPPFFQVCLGFEKSRIRIRIQRAVQKGSSPQAPDLNRRRRKCVRRGSRMAPRYSEASACTVRMSGDDHVLGCVRHSALKGRLDRATASSPICAGCATVNLSWNGPCTSSGWFSFNVVSCRCSCAS